MEQGWTVVVNTKKILKQKALERKRQELAEQGIYELPEDKKDKKANNKKDKKRSVKAKNAAKSAKFEANGYTLNFANDTKKNTPSQKVKSKNAPSEQKVEEKNEKKEQKIKIVDGKTFDKFIETISSLDSENYSYQLVKLSNEFDNCSFVKKTNSYQSLPKDIQDSLTSFISSIAETKPDDISGALDFLFDDFVENSKGARCLFDAFAYICPNILYDNCKSLLSKGRNFYDSVLLIYRPIFDFNMSLALLCYINFFKQIICSQNKIIIFKIK